MSLLMAKRRVPGPSCRLEDAWATVTLARASAGIRVESGLLGGPLPTILAHDPGPRRRPRDALRRDAGDVLGPLRRTPTRCPGSAYPCQHLALPNAAANRPGQVRPGLASGQTRPAAAACRGRLKRRPPCFGLCPRDRAAAPQVLASAVQVGPACGGPDKATSALCGVSHRRISCKYRCLNSIAPSDLLVRGAELTMPRIARPTTSPLVSPVSRNSHATQLAAEGLWGLWPIREGRVFWPAQPHSAIGAALMDLAPSDP